MTHPRLHADEPEIDATLVRRLLARQHPSYAALPVERVQSTGTDNAIYRLGPEFAARLPRRATAAGQLAREAHWLPRLAPLLPLPIPAPLALGERGEGYPFAWGVYRWVEGEPAAAGRIANMDAAADALADFVAALQGVDARDAPRPDAANAFRGTPLAPRDRATRAAIGQMVGDIDTVAATAAWESALAAPVHDGPPAWLHGDVSPFNLLARDGAIAAVIDFGCMAAGDPACDLQVAWNLLTPAARARFRQRLAVDDAAWARGRGWALSVALIQLPYYRDTNPGLAANARETIAAVLADAPGA